MANARIRNPRKIPNDQDAEQIKSGILTLVKNAASIVRDSYSNTRYNAVQAQRKVTRQIRNNPVRSSLIAAGIGFALGALIRR